MAYILSLCINISLGKLPILPTPIIKFDNDFKLLGCYQDSDVKCFPYDMCFVKVSFFPLSIIFGFVLFLAGLGFPGSSDGKEYTCNAGDLSSVPGLGKSPGGGHGNPLQYSCLENSVDRGAWRATVHRFTKRGTRLSAHAWQASARTS